MNNKKIIAIVAGLIFMTLAIYVHISASFAEMSAFSNMYTIAQSAHYESFGRFDITEKQLGSVIKESKGIQCFSSLDGVPKNIQKLFHNNTKPYLDSKNFRYTCTRSSFGGQIKLVFSTSNLKELNKIIALEGMNYRLIFNNE
jgi:hypothetical protein